MVGLLVVGTLLLAGALGVALAMLGVLSRRLALLEQSERRHVVEREREKLQRIKASADNITLHPNHPDADQPEPQRRKKHLRMYIGGGMAAVLGWLRHAGAAHSRVVAAMVVSTAVVTTLVWVVAPDFRAVDPSGRHGVVPTSSPTAVASVAPSHAGRAPTSRASSGPTVMPQPTGTGGAGALARSSNLDMHAVSPVGVQVGVAAPSDVAPLGDVTRVAGITAPVRGAALKAPVCAGLKALGGITAGHGLAATCR